MDEKLQPENLLQRGDAAAGDGNLLFGAVERQKERAALHGLDFLDHIEIDQVAAMHTEEPMALEALLELREGDRGEIPVGVGLQVGVVVARSGWYRLG